MDVDALLREGDLSGVRAGLVDLVRSQPGNVQGRMFLFQLLAVTGEWDKALNQLQSLVQLSPEAQMLGVTYGQAIAAEKQREAVFAGERDMALLFGSGGWAEGVARAISLLARGDGDAADRARDEAFEGAPDMPGALDGIRFEWIADADSRFGPTFEAIVWVANMVDPVRRGAVRRASGPPEICATLSGFRSRLHSVLCQSAVAFLPARYPGSKMQG
ncbi:MAG: virulence protein SciE type [Caenibius sp.]